MKTQNSMQIFQYDDSESLGDIPGKTQRIRSKHQTNHIRDLNRSLERDEVNKMSAGERQRREVYAVACGAIVSYSSCYNIKHTHYQLDYSLKDPQAWQANHNKKGQWIQVSCENPKYWTAIIIQGRGDLGQWVTKFIIGYTLNGKSWQHFGDGIVFTGNQDRSTKTTIQFKKGIFARAIRIYPQEWYCQMSLRFEAVYLDLS